MADVATDADLSAEVDPITAGEPIDSSADVHDDMHDRELEREVKGQCLKRLCHFSTTES